MKYAEVAVPTPVHRAFTYRIPEGFAVDVGQRVIAPFRRRKVAGIVIDVTDRSPLISADRIKDIESTPDDKVRLSFNLVKLIEWMSSYYVAPIGEVVRSALPKRLLSMDAPRTTRPHLPFEMTPMPLDGFDLNREQRCALDTILKSTGNGEMGRFLLHGITGSGKTEVYFRFFEKLIASGKQGLLLVPEIGLTPQLTGRAAARFGERVSVYHSSLTDAQRHEQWRRISGGEVDVVIGTRSALFAPLPKLGAIVVDEEHDNSFKQGEGFTYSGRDSAVMRATIERVPVILGSATPSLESIANVENGKYTKLMLNERPGAARLPTIEIVDMRKESLRKLSDMKTEGARRMPELCSLSPRLYDAICDSLDAKEQVLLYLGRRGFSSSVQCEMCGYVFVCPNCDIPLTVHRGKNCDERFVCHYCDYTVSRPSTCAVCSSSDLTSLGAGTERLEAEICDFFPGARVARLDSDMAAKHTARRKVLDRMRKREIDILIGTQMITKGHDFPSITLVGVVCADQSLSFPDFRSAERTFQLITQVAGRAGRAALPGRVIVQTRQPDHYSFTAARDHDFDLFSKSELQHRKELNYPPYSRLATVRVSAMKVAVARKVAQELHRCLENLLRANPVLKSTSVLGPAPAMVEKLRGRYRWQMLLKSPSSNSLTWLIKTVHPEFMKLVPSGVRLTIDVDPMYIV